MFWRASNQNPVESRSFDDEIEGEQYFLRMRRRVLAKARELPWQIGSRVQVPTFVQECKAGGGGAAMPARAARVGRHKQHERKLLAMQCVLQRKSAPARHMHSRAHTHLAEACARLSASLVQSEIL